MNSIKEEKIRKAVDNRIKEFADNLIKRYQKELNEPNGVINSKKKNIFINSLGNEFIFNSAFCRSFDSSFGNVLESLSNDIADITFEVITEDISSYLLPQQTQHIDYIMSDYEKHAKQPEISETENKDLYFEGQIIEIPVQEGEDYFGIFDLRGRDCSMVLRQSLDGQTATLCLNTFGQIDNENLRRLKDAVYRKTGEIAPELTIELYDDTDGEMYYRY